MRSPNCRRVEVNLALWAALGGVGGLYVFQHVPVAVVGVMVTLASLSTVAHVAVLPRRGSLPRPAAATTVATETTAPGMQTLRDPTRNLRILAALCCAVCIGLILGGGVRVHLHTEAASQYLPVAKGEVQSIQGRVLEDGRRTNRGSWMTTVEVDRVATSSGAYDARLTVLVFSSGARPTDGRRATFVGGLEGSDSPHNELYLSSDRVSYGEATFLGRLRTATGGRLESALSQLGPSSGLAGALLLGRRDGLSTYTQDLFRMSGTSHVLALSGMHLGILIAMTLFVLSRFVGKRTALVAALVLTAGYLFVVGFRASLVRAALMFACAVGAVLLDRKADPLRILAAAFIVLMAAAPASVDTLSFQLSFAALAGIIVFGGWLNRLMIPWVPGWVRSPLAASAGAQLATMPLVLSAFGTARPVGIIATLAVGPLAVLFVWLAVFGVFVVLLGGGELLIGAVGNLMSGLEKILVGAAEIFAGAQGVTTPETGPVVVGIFVCCLAAGVAYLGGPPRHRREPEEVYTQRALDEDRSDYKRMMPTGGNGVWL